MRKFGKSFFMIALIAVISILSVTSNVFCSNYSATVRAFKRVGLAPINKFENAKIYSNWGAGYALRCLKIEDSPQKLADFVTQSPLIKNIEPIRYDSSTQYLHIPDLRTISKQQQEALAANDLHSDYFVFPKAPEWFNPELLHGGLRYHAAVDAEGEEVVDVIINPETSTLYVALVEN